MGGARWAVAAATLFGLSGCSDPDFEMAASMVDEKNCREAVPILEKVTKDRPKVDAFALLSECLLTTGSGDPKEDREARRTRGKEALAEALRRGFTPGNVSWTDALIATPILPFDAVPIDDERFDWVQEIHGALPDGSLIASVRKAKSRATAILRLEPDHATVLFDPADPPPGATLGADVVPSAWVGGGKVVVTASVNRREERRWDREIWTGDGDTLTRAGLFTQSLADTVDVFATDGDRLLGLLARSIDATAPDVIEAIDVQTRETTRLAEIAAPGVVTHPAFDPRTRRVYFSLVSDPRGENGEILPFTVTLYRVDLDGGNLTPLGDLDKLMAPVGGARDPKFWFRSGANVGFTPDAGVLVLSRDEDAGIRWDEAKGTAEKVVYVPHATPGVDTVWRVSERGAYRSDWKRWRTFQDMAAVKFGTPEQWKTALGTE